MNENEVKKEYNFDNKDAIFSSKRRDAIKYSKDEEKNLKELETNKTNLNYFKEYHKRTQSFIMTACIVYSFFLLLFIIWTLINLWSRWNQLIEPVSSNGFDLHNFQQLIYPSITVCNIVPDVNLIHNKCKNFEEEIKCPYKEDKITYKQTKLRKKQVISCLTYNNNIEDAFVTSKLGMQDMLIISVKINIKDYPSNSFTSGVHISFHTQGSNIESGSGLIASSGQVTLIRLKKTINEYLNNTTIESFDGKISTIGDYNFEENWGSKNDTVVLAMTYQDLNVMIVKELPPYDVLTFLSETGGVLGLLLGTSLVNLIVFLIQWAWGLKFNETNWANVQNRKEDEMDEDWKLRAIGAQFGIMSGICFGSFGDLEKKGKNNFNKLNDTNNYNNRGVDGEKNKNISKSDNEYCDMKSNGLQVEDGEQHEENCGEQLKMDQIAHKTHKRRESDYFNNSGDLVDNNEDAFIYQKISII